MEGLRDKKELRRTFLEKRRHIDPKINEHLDKKIAENLFESEIFKSADTILIYVSTKPEINTRPIIERAFESEKRVAVPKTEGNGHMNFVFIESFDELEIGRFGILEPKNHLKKVFDFSKPALCIVPGLCFDKDGFRVGYGGGYYDRFLCKFKGLSAGLCYDKNVLKSIDFDEYDVSVDCLVTESGIKKINRRENDG